MDDSSSFQDEINEVNGSVEGDRKGVSGKEEVGASQVDGTGGTREESEEEGLDGSGGSKEEFDGSGGSKEEVDGSGGSKEELDGSGGSKEELDGCGGSKEELDGSGGSKEELDGSGGSKEELDGSGGSKEGREEEELDGSGGSKEGREEEELDGSGGSKEGREEEELDGSGGSKEGREEEELDGSGGSKEGREEEELDGSGGSKEGREEEELDGSGGSKEELDGCGGSKEELDWSGGSKEESEEEGLDGSDKEEGLDGSDKEGLDGSGGSKEGSEEEELDGSDGSKEEVGAREEERLDGSDGSKDELDGSDGSKEEGEEEGLESSSEREDSAKEVDDDGSKAGSDSLGEGSGEENEKEELQKSSPMFVPTGPYFMHDSRSGPTDENEVESKRVVTDKSRADVDNWKHDLYIEEEQCPKEQWEKEKDFKMSERYEQRRTGKKTVGSYYEQPRKGREWGTRRRNWQGGEERFIKPQNRKEAGDNWYTGRSGSWNRTRKDMRAYGSKGGGRGEKFSDKKQEPKGADIKEKIDTRVSREKDVSVKEVENSTTVTEKPKEESTQSKGVSEDQLHEVIEQVNQDPEQVHKNQDVSSEDNHVAQRNDSKEVNVESENKLTVEQSKEQNAARWRGRGRGMREKLGLPKVGSINKKGDSHLEEARDEKGSLQAASKPKRYSSQRQKGKDGEQGEQAVPGWSLNPMYLGYQVPVDYSALAMSNPVAMQQWMWHQQMQMHRAAMGVPAAGPYQQPPPVNTSQPFPYVIVPSMPLEQQQKLVHSEKPRSQAIPIVEPKVEP